MENMTKKEISSFHWVVVVLGVNWCLLLTFNLQFTRSGAKNYSHSLILTSSLLNTTWIHSRGLLFIDQSPNVHSAVGILLEAANRVSLIIVLRPIFSSFTFFLPFISQLHEEDDSAEKLQPGVLNRATPPEMNGANVTYIMMKAIFVYQLHLLRFRTYFSQEIH